MIDSIIEDGLLHYYYYYILYYIYIFLVSYLIKQFNPNSSNNQGPIIKT